VYIIGRVCVERKRKIEECNGLYRENEMVRNKRGDTHSLKTLNVWNFLYSSLLPSKKGI
jgi:hypothetical protein